MFYAEELAWIFYMDQGDSIRLSLKSFKCDNYKPS